MAQRVLFMGSPQFAVPTLQALMSGYQVVGVVTQPDRPSGRGRQLHPPPVKAVAQARGLPVLQPASLRSPEAIAELQALHPDVIVVAAFGQILRPAVLDLPPFGCLNVHASLLPRWRGAAPIAAAILAGDETAGITIMRMDPGLDTGPILRQRALPIAPDDTAESLGEKLARLGADLLLDTLPDWLAGRIEPQPQDDAQATFAPQLEKEQGHIDWSEPADAIARQVRAFHPWPGTFTTWQGAPLRILRASAEPSSAEGTLTGTVVATPEGPAVATGRGWLRLIEVQPAGKRPMPASAFVRGARGFLGSRLM
jgi:methionyl-tRNA formyltransferase